MNGCQTDRGDVLTKSYKSAYVEGAGPETRVLGMGGGRRPRGWGSATLVVVLITLLAAGAPAAGQLYSQTYPGSETSVIGPGETIEDALTKASLKTAFNVKQLTEDEEAHFTATVFYAGKLDPNLETIEVAYANDATLKPEKGKFDIVRETGTRRYLNEGTRVATGGYELSWRWAVTPRQTGSLALTLEIQPVVSVVGSSREDLRVRNEPIKIKVRVHPNKKALAEVVSAAKELRIDYPDRLHVGKETPVTAVLELKGHGDVVNADITLGRDQGSVPATIKEAMAPPENPTTQSVQDQFVRRWLVTPAEAGPVDMLFTVRLSTEAGDLPLTKQVKLSKSVQADPPSPSLWKRLQGFVIGLTSLVFLIAGILGIKPALEKWRRRGGDESD
jgi:hypothetical protein